MATAFLLKHLTPKMRLLLSGRSDAVDPLGSPLALKDEFAIYRLYPDLSRL
jgi:hypothetical protein